MLYANTRPVEAWMIFYTDSKSLSASRRETLQVDQATSFAHCQGRSVYFHLLGERLSARPRARARSWVLI